MSRIIKGIAGCVVLFFVNVLWVGGSELTKALYAKYAYPKPFFTTYFKSSCFMVYFVVLLRYFIHKKEKTAPNEDKTASSFERTKARSSDTEVDIGESTSTIPGRRSVQFAEYCEVRTFKKEPLVDFYEFRCPNITEKGIIRKSLDVAIPIGIMWFPANYTYQLALLQTQPSIVNVLSTLSSFFVIVVGACFPSGPEDTFTLTKLLSALLNVAGVVLISISDTDFEAKPWGIILSIISAMLYGGYVVYLKKACPDESSMSFPMFFAFLGMFIAVAYLPVLFILDGTNVEKFEWPNKMQWPILAINTGLGTILSEALWLSGLYLTSGLTATLAMSLMIPLSLLADYFVSGVEIGLTEGLGSIPILIGFLLSAIASEMDNWDPVWWLVRGLLQRGRSLIMFVICRWRFKRWNVNLDSEQRSTLLDNEHLS